MLGRKSILSFVLAVLVGSTAWAQEGGGGGGGGGNRRDPAQMREQFINRMKEQLKATDEEFQVLLPKIEKVTEAQRNSRAGWGGRGGFGGGGGGQQRAPETELGKASADLQATLDKGSVSEEEIAAKLAAYRAVRDKALADLQAARNDLKDVVTPQQEATLVLFGILE